MRDERVTKTFRLPLSVLELLGRAATTEGKSMNSYLTDHIRDDAMLTIEEAAFPVYGVIYDHHGIYECNHVYLAEELQPHVERLPELDDYLEGHTSAGKTYWLCYLGSRNEVCAFLRGEYNCVPDDVSSEVRQDWHFFRSPNCLFSGKRLRLANHFFGLEPAEVYGDAETSHLGRYLIDTLTSLKDETQEAIQLPVFPAGLTRREMEWIVFWATLSEDEKASFSNEFSNETNSRNKLDKLYNSVKTVSPQALKTYIQLVHDMESWAVENAIESVCAIQKAYYNDKKEESEIATALDMSLDQVQKVLDGFCYSRF